jgi:hypothetical protein
VFRNVDIWNSDARKSPKQKNTNCRYCSPVFRLQ